MVRGSGSIHQLILKFHGESKLMEEVSGSVHQLILKFQVESWLMEEWSWPGHQLLEGNREIFDRV